jgi:hypothetical protein
VEPRQIAPQAFKPVGRRHQQIVEAPRGIQHFELSLCRSRKALEFSDKLVAEQFFSLPVAERLDHEESYRFPV